MDLHRSFETGLDSLGIPWTADQVERGLEFIRMIEKWNRIDNLTAITRLDQMVSHHLLDSLSIHSALEGAGNILDVGSGAGLPGIPLALFNPGIRFTLLDAAAKRVRFMRQATVALGLQNVVVEQNRVQSVSDDRCFDVIISRAFASVSDFIEQSAPLLAPGGRILAMKGRLQDDELSELPDKFKYTVIPLQVPGLEAQRHLITITAV